MPPKTVKLDGGTKWTLKSIRLANGDLLIPQRHPTLRSVVDWVPVSPGTSDHKRWSSVACDEPDPRETDAYKEFKAELEAKLKDSE